MEVNRLLVLGGIVYAGWFTVPMSVAQDRQIEVTVFALAEFPLLRELASMDESFPEPILSEYKLLESWISDKWGDDRPSWFYLFAVVENLGELPMEEVKLVLTRDRKIGEWEYRFEPPYAWETAQWEGPIPAETRSIGMLDGMSARYVRFGPLSADELITADLLDQDLWTWEARYGVTVRCDGCVTSTATWSFRLGFDL